MAERPHRSSNINERWSQHSTQLSAKGAGTGAKKKKKIKSNFKIESKEEITAIAGYFLKYRHCRAHEICQTFISDAASAYKRKFNLELSEEKDEELVQVKTFIIFIW